MTILLSGFGIRPRRDRQASDSAYFQMTKQNPAQVRGGAGWASRNERERTGTTKLAEIADIQSFLTPLVEFLIDFLFPALEIIL